MPAPMNRERSVACLCGEGGGLGFRFFASLNPICTRLTHTPTSQCQVTILSLHRAPRSMSGRDRDEDQTRIKTKHWRCSAGHPKKKKASKHRRCEIPAASMGRGFAR